MPALCREGRQWGVYRTLIALSRPSGLVPELTSIQEPSRSAMLNFVDFVRNSCLISLKMMLTEEVGIASRSLQIE